MKSTHFFSDMAKHPVSTIILLLAAAVVVYLMVGDISGMQAATTNYEYYTNLVYLIDNIGRTYFCVVFLLMAYLTYINKQYSKWCIWLFYLAGASVLIYFVVAGNLFECIFNHIESEYMNQLPSIARTLFTGPLYWMIVGYFFVPKILKDAQKLKQEQDLTI